MGIAKRVKSYFLRGLAVLLPTVVTIWILVWGYRFTQEHISYHINRGLVWLIMRTPMNSWPEDTLTKFWVDGAGSIAGFIIALIGVLVIGTLLASVVGKTVWRIIEGFITNTPVLRRIYPYVKQVTDFVLTPDEQKQLFSRVVAVEWPRKGVWSIGFVTGSGLTRVVDNVEKEFLTVLIPNTPTPVTGYVVLIPKEETIVLDMTVEEAFRFAISAGVVTPVGQRVAALSEADS